MATRSQPKLLAQGKSHTRGGKRPWRVRPYAPGAGTHKHGSTSGHQPAKASRGSGCCAAVPRKTRPARSRPGRGRARHRAGDARGRADVRASRTIRMLGEEYLSDSIERGRQPRTMEQPSHGSTPTAWRPSATSLWRSGGSSTTARCWRRSRRHISSSAAASTSAASSRRCASLRGGGAGSTAASTRSTAWRSGGPTSCLERQRSMSTHARARRPVR